MTPVPGIGDSNMLGQFTIITKARLSRYSYLLDSGYDCGSVFLVPFRNKLVKAIFLGIQTGEHDPSIEFKRVDSYLYTIHRSVWKNVIALHCTAGTPIGNLLHNRIDDYEYSNLEVTKQDYKLQDDISLREDQLLLLRELKQWIVHKPVLLSARTGFGKTEVYLHYLYQVLLSNQKVLIVCPEILLVEYMFQRISARLKGEVVLWHSNLGARLKKRNISRLRSPGPLLIIATRSALILPIADLGLVILEEAHELSISQEVWPYYYPIELIRYKTTYQVILVTATPNLELWVYLKEGRLKMIGQVEDALPPWNRRGHFSLVEDSQLDLEIVLKIWRVLITGMNVVLYINHRGYSNRILNLSNNKLLRCHVCNQYIYYHRMMNTWSCHNCKKSYEVGSKELVKDDGYVYLGVGIERLYMHLRSYFYSHKLHWISSDTGQSKTREMILNQLHYGRSHLILATQILIKGYHTGTVGAVVLFVSEFNHYNSLSEIYINLLQAAGRTQKDQVYLQVNTKFQQWRTLLGRGLRDVLEQESVRIESGVRKVSWHVRNKASLQKLMLIISQKFLHCRLNIAQSKEGYFLNIRINLAMLKDLIPLIPSDLMRYRIHSLI